MSPQIRDIISRLQRDASALGITLYAGAIDDDFTEFEHALGFALPDDVKDFYRFSNGFESAEFLFRIVPLDEIVTDKAQFPPNQCDFAEYLLYSDMWTLEVNPSRRDVYSIFHSDHDSERLNLTNSFAEFLTVFLNHGVFGPQGLYDWHAATKRMPTS